MTDTDNISADGERGRRLAKLDALRAAGVDPYPVRFDRTHTSAEVLRHWGEIEAGAVAQRGERELAHRAHQDDPARHAHRVVGLGAGLEVAPALEHLG